MLKKLFVAALGLAFFTTAALADITIATGKAGGGYDKSSQTLATRLIQRGINATVVNLDGSEAISLALCNGSAQVGPMQVDAVWARAQEGCTLKAIGSYGDEHAMLFFPPKSKYDELSDLTAANTILADTVGSGSDLWLRTAIKIEKGDDGSKDKWSDVQIVNDPVMLATASAEMGEIQAVLLVRKVNSPDVAQLLENGWTLGELYDKDINDLMFKGQPLYEAEKITAEFSGKKFKNWSYVVRTSIMAAPSLVTGDRQTFMTVSSAVNQ